MYWLAGAAYLRELEPEVFKFPKSKKKDQVDCLSMICDILSSPRGPVMWSIDTPVAHIAPQLAPLPATPDPSQPTVMQIEVSETPDSVMKLLAQDPENTEWVEDGQWIDLEIGGGW